MKEFIQKHKSDFDQEKPSAELWSKIESNLPAENKGRMIPMKRLWQTVTGLTAVFVLTVFALQYMNKDRFDLAEEQVNPAEISNVEQLEKYYTTQVNNRMEALSAYEVDEELLGEVALLKEEFDILKQEAGTGVNQEEILDEMIDNYRLRVDILEAIMKEVSKSSKDNNHVVQ